MKNIYSSPDSLIAPHPKRLIEDFSDETLTIHAGAHANSRQAEPIKVPNHVNLRYEHDIGKLYIARRFFTEHDLKDLIRALRNYSTYVGSLQMRIDKGTRRKSSPITCYCFDLTQQHVLKERVYGRKEHTIRHHEKELEYLNTEIRTAYPLQIKKDLRQLDRMLADIPDQYYRTKVVEMCRTVRKIADRTVRIQLETLNMLNRGHVQRKYKKALAEQPPRERTKFDGFDQLIKLCLPKTARYYDVYRVRTDGTVQHRKEDILPFEVIDKFTGKNEMSAAYSETSHSDGSGHCKFIWIRMGLVRWAVQEGILPKNYMDDKRCVVKENHYFLRTTVYCLKLDLRR